jgi:hypothetical protein
MTQLSLLDFTPAPVAPIAAPAAEIAPTAGAGPGWYVVDLYTLDAIRGPYETPDDAAAELDEIDEDGTHCRLAFRPIQEI